MSVNSKRVLRPPSLRPRISFSELYSFRYLLLGMAIRDIKVKYAQTIIGLLWAVIQPLITVVLLTFVFQKIGNVDTEGTPPALFTLVGYAIWSYFSSVMTGASSSVISAQRLIQKVYFPRLVLPLSKVISGFVEFGVLLLMIVISVIYYGYRPSLNMLYCIPVVFLAIIFSVACGIWISAITVRYRDFRFITPFLLQIGLFLTPIAYPLSAVPENHRLLYQFNPMTGIVESFRYSVLGVSQPIPSVYYSIIVTIVLFVTGVIYFSKVQEVMADIV